MRAHLAIAFLLAIPSCASAQDSPYSLADGVTICHRNEHLEQMLEEGMPTTKVVFNDGFEACPDIINWYILRAPERRRDDLIVIRALEKQYGKAPLRQDFQHVK